MRVTYDIKDTSSFSSQLNWMNRIIFFKKWYFSYVFLILYLLASLSSACTFIVGRLSDTLWNASEISSASASASASVSATATATAILSAVNVQVQLRVYVFEEVEGKFKCNFNGLLDGSEKKHWNTKKDCQKHLKSACKSKIHPVKVYIMH